ncbi:MAG: alpha/beta fold hydrolase [Chloroflexi bacterium]|nr:alpha/beta fold hydrolase [Chloroflexota bacterium]
MMAAPRIIAILGLLGLMGSLLVGCTPAAPTTALPTLMATAVFPTPTAVLPVGVLPGTYTPAPPPTSAPIATIWPTTTPPPTAKPGASPDATPGASPDATPIVNPFAGLTIDELTARPYGGSPLQIVESLGELPGFNRSLISYVSDGLTVYGFMNTPPGTGPLPVVIVLHGYVDPAEYQVLAYTTPYADAFAKAGYLVIHPNYRSYPPSDSGPNLFRVGYAIDTLNLIAAIKQQAGQPGPLARADANAIYLFGHSMGGGIALRVLTVSQDVRAAALYGSMSGDERRNFARIWEWSGGADGRIELDTADELVWQISPANYLERIQTPISLHHGLDDGVVPSIWSDQLCEALRALGKTVECLHYPGQLHNFDSAAQQRLLRNVRDFFGRN